MYVKRQKISFLLVLPGKEDTFYTLIAVLPLRVLFSSRLQQ